MLEDQKTFNMKSMIICLCVLFVQISDILAANEHIVISKLSIRSDIGFRFANTQVKAKLENKQNAASEATFHVTLPNTAFMTKFSMNVDGKIIKGEVKEKSAAKSQYEEAKGQGQSAGHVAATTRDSNTFRVFVNVAARSSVVFDLIYQEVLQRRLGYYEHVINIDPGQIVPGMRVLVNIKESRPITKLSVPLIRKDGQSHNDNQQNPDAKIKRIGSSSAVITYHPSIHTQNKMSDKGIRGQFLVRYDVKRGLDTGEIQVVNGYFVHALAPAGLPPIPKNILFILDVSGSMLGKKIQQVKDAMNTILNDVRHYDTFNLLTFASRASLWKNEMLPVSHSTIAEAKRFVSSMRASGGTAMNTALINGINFLKQQDTVYTDRPSIIVFLTDGMPTVGQTNTNTILKNVQKTNNGLYSIFALGFGNGVKYDLLKQLSLQNSGLARKIYEASDATLQLENFYQEVSIPLLSDVNITYHTQTTDDKVTDVTKHKYKTYFSGGEMFIAGKVTSLKRRIWIRPCFSAKTDHGRIIRICPPHPWPPITPPTPTPWVPETGLRAYIERMWAYLTIQDLLDKDIHTYKTTEKSELKKKALQLSLKFGFVTPLTSMVVTLPNNPRQNLGGLKETQKNGGSSSGSGLPSRGRGWFGGWRRRMPSRVNSGLLRPVFNKAFSATMLSHSITTGITTAPVKVSPPSMIVQLSPGAVCLSWPQMAFSSHSLLKQQGTEIRVSHGRLGTVESVIITSLIDTYIITPSHLLIGTDLKTWTDRYHSSTVIVQNNIAKVKVLPGVKVAVHKQSDSSLILEFEDVSGVTSQNASGMLKNVSSWKVTGSHLRVNAQKRFPAVNTNTGGINCKSVAKDIFDVTDTARRA